MPRISSKHFENFGDGLLTICEADERSLTRTKLEHIRFGNRTVGVTRYWKAQTAGNQVDKLLAIPLEVLDAEQIEVNDVIILENETAGVVFITGKADAPVQRWEGFWWQLKSET